jgi:NADH dehydrogenase FAD-containing subunit
LKVHLGPLARWCNAEYVQKRVQRIVGNENKLILEDGEALDYDVLAINCGSRTKDTQNLSGVKEYALTTRPINEILNKIKKRE